MNGPLKWHGGKHYLASRIVALMPAHVHYVEPYAGGLSVLLAKDQEGVSEVVNDRHAALINFWTVLADADSFAGFERRIQATPFSQWHWLGAADGKTPELPCDVEAACDFFVRCRQSLAGRGQGFAPLSRNRVRRGMNEQASAWLNAVEGLREVHERLRRVVILGPCDALEVIRREDGPKTLFYLDPPYLHETRATTGEYQHEMSAAEHDQLLFALTSLQGKFLLSGYRSQLYENYASAQNWKRQDFELPNNAAGGASKRRMTECVWCNF